MLEGGINLDLDEAYQVYVNDLYRYLYSLSKDHFTAEDLVQEAFYRAYIQLEDYEIHNIKAWLFKVAYNSFIDYQRKHKRLVISDVLIEPHHLDTPEKQMLAKDRFLQLMEDIHTLKEQERHVIVLCDLHQLQYNEAAEILELNINTLKSHLFRGRKKLMERVKERMDRDD
jgi:RNA polymerase sigma-70 factor, ECF subfamily